MQEIEKKEVKKWKINALLIGNTFDSQNTFLELHLWQIQMSGLPLRQMSGLLLSRLCPKGQSSTMINVLTMAQDSFGCVPIIVDYEVLLKGFNLDRDFFFQLK